MSESKESKNDSFLNLTEEEIKILIALASQITTIQECNNLDFCKKAECLSLLVPERISSALKDFAKHGSETGYFFIKNLKIKHDEIPETPKNNTYRLGEKTEIAKIQAILTSIMGYMVGYEAECFGNLFQDVVPNESMAKNQTSLGSNIELEIHTEQAFSKLRPDILSLACLKGDDNAYTHILPIQSILNNTSAEEHKLLQMPLWKTGVDLSFKLNGHEFIEGDVRGPMPIINDLPIINDSKNTQNLILTFDQDLMTGLTEQANDLLKKVVSIYYKHRLSHNLKPGEILFVNNNKAVHGRSPFFPKYDGTDRFLVRCFAIFEIEKAQYAILNNNRVISAIYS